MGEFYLLTININKIICQSVCRVFASLTADFTDVDNTGICENFERWHVISNNVAF